MSAYKNKDNGTWIAKFRIKNWKGETKYICKRGFATRRDAVNYEVNFKSTQSNYQDMKFSDYAETYINDVIVRIKESTMESKINIINTKITPYFANFKISDIQTTHIMKWQNELMSYINPKTGEKYRSSYLKSVHNELSAMLNHAVKYYGLKKNVAAIVGNMGNEKEIRMKFWTLEQYRIFIQAIIDKPILYYAFEILYWCGLREGEMLALTFGDIDFSNNTISITKTYHRIHKKDIITTPKTPKSNRVIAMPKELAEELKDFFSMLVDTDKDARIFEGVTKSTLYKAMHDACKNTGLPKIRVHDLRHSHVSLLINNGFSALAIADRMGHESETITYRYAHLFPNVQKQMAETLDKLKGED